MAHAIDYANLMHNAMRDLIKSVLKGVASDGLPDPHHFFITFETEYPGVIISQWLRERYPEEMTIVIQNWFEDLNVTDDGFSITLNFGNSPEPLYIPFAALRTFVDPSVEFGLRFETTEDEDDSLDDLDLADGVDETQDPAAHKDAEIVNLEQFRKR